MRDSTASNYNPLATYGDGSCVFNQVGGCTDISANNYNSSATYDDGSCTYTQDTSAPISAPSTVPSRKPFTPVCGAAIFFDVPNVFPPMLCGTSISLSGDNGAIYEIRGLIKMEI